MPPQNQRPASDSLSVKQQRDARRAEKVAALKKRQAAERRNRLIGIILGSVAALAVVALVITLVVTSGNSNNTDAQSTDNDVAGTADDSIEGLMRFDDLTANHVAGTVDYTQTPPVGGDHNAVWLNCGVYSEPVPNENAVHDLEHGAVWVTYNPDEVTGDDLSALRDALPDTYITLSPWPDLESPVVASAWGAQIDLDGADDARLQQFIDMFWQSPDAPEPGAPCTGGVDGPGLVS